MSDTSDSSAEPTPTDSDIHPGWAMTPQDEYELGVSGGWGTPGEHLTGPIPRLRPSVPPGEPVEPDRDGGPEQAASAGQDG